MYHLILLGTDSRAGQQSLPTLPPRTILPPRPYWARPGPKQSCRGSGLPTTPISRASPRHFCRDFGLLQPLPTTLLEQQGLTLACAMTLGPPADEGPKLPVEEAIDLPLAAASQNSATKTSSFHQLQNLPSQGRWSLHSIDIKRARTTAVGYMSNIRSSHLAARPGSSTPGAARPRSLPVTRPPSWEAIPFRHLFFLHWAATLFPRPFATRT